MNGYEYYGCRKTVPDAQRNQEAALELSGNRLNPRLTDPDFLILRKRAALIRECLERIPDTGLEILDVGGRLQPYRPLLKSRARRYLAIDPQIEGLADVVAVAEQIPFSDDQFDLVICAQVLSYVDDPTAAVSEMHRVLKSGGYLFMSVPSTCPQFHDERWRFLHAGIETLLSDFPRVDIWPEVYSLGGALRTINRFLELSPSTVAKKIAARALIPFMNVIGRRFDDRVFRSEFFTVNYSAMAQK